MDKDGGIDVKRHIAVWREGSIRALACVETLLRAGFADEGLFWAHLAIEKVLKAHVLQKTAAQPPYIHNLVRLATIADLDLSDLQNRICVELHECHITGRYFEDGVPALSPGDAQDLWIRTREFHAWLINKL